MKIFSLSLFAFGFALSSAAFAAGGSSSGGTATDPAPVPGAATSPTQLHCKTGEVVKTITKNGKKVKVCAKVTAGILPDNELYQQGWLLAKTGEYDWALSVFDAIANKNDAATLTMMGYANRKAGRLEIGITYYDQALALQPDFVRAREYLGEGYVAAGRVDLAKVQLNEIAKRAGTASVEYVDLAKAISGTSDEL